MRIGKVHLVELGYLDFAVVSVGRLEPIGRSARIEQMTQLSVRYNELDSELMEERRRCREARAEGRAWLSAGWANVVSEGR